MKAKGPKKSDPKPRRDRPPTQKLRTFNNSQLSLLDERNHQLSSATNLGIFKNQTIARRRANNSAMSQYGPNPVSAKPLSAKSKGKKKKKPLATGKQTKSKPKIVMEEYQRAKYKQSNSNSEIVFSNDQTKRSSAIGGEMPYKTDLYLHQLQARANQEDSNLILRVSIKREYIRKVQAAIKIQKAFRQYLTRKLLMKYVVDEEVQRRRQNQRFSSSLSSRRERSIGSTFRECQDLSSSIFDQNRSYLLHKNVPSRAIQSREQNNSDSEFQELKRNARAQEKQREQLYSQRERENEEDSESDEEGGEMVYRHQNPIYSHEEIGDFLGSSGEEDDEAEWNDAYEPDIIFETNQQYLQSRKSSLQNKNQPVNRLSNKGIAEIMNLRKEDKDIFQIIQRENQRNTEKHAESFEHQQSKQELQFNQKNLKKEDIVNKRTQVTEGNQQFREDQENHEKTIKYDQTNKIKLNQRTEKKLFQPQEKIPEESSSSQSKSRGSLIQDKTLKSGEVSQNMRNFIEVQEKQVKQKVEQLVGEKKMKKIEDFELKDTTQVSGMRKLNMRFTHEDLSKYLDEYDESEKQKSNSRKSHSRSGSGVSSEFSRSASINQEELFRLREQQCERWEEVIKMVNSQIKKNNENNGEMMNFMKSIMEFSQKNKELLGSTREINLQTGQHTTPTSLDTPLHWKYGLQQLPPSSQSHSQSKPQQEEDGKTPKKFFKKKDLKIDIIDEVEQDKIFEELRDSSSFSKKPKKQQPSSFTIISEAKKKDSDSCPIQSRHHGEFKKKGLPFTDSIEEDERDSSHAIVPRLESTTNKLKSFFSSNLQIQDEAILEILRLREELLQRRECQELVKLNHDLSGGKLQQGEFIQRLESLTKKFSEEKQAIDKAKTDITKGYQAANQLVKEYFYDVRRMGIKLAVSRSQDNLKYKLSPPLLGSSDLVIDELTPKSTPKQIKRIFGDHQIQDHSISNKRKEESEEDSEVQFTEEQLKRFRKAATFNLQLNELNGNMTTISDDFIKQQQGANPNDNYSKSIFSFEMSPQPTQMRENVPVRETYHLSEEKTIVPERSHPEIDALVQHQIEMLVWEFAAQLIVRPTVSDKFMDKSYLTKPEVVSEEERSRFLEILTENLPDNHVLHSKLNQKITPMPTEILKCMRLDFSEEQEYEDEDECYEEISKYQFVISQEVCIKAVTTFKNELDQRDQQAQEAYEKNSKSLVPFAEIKQNCPFSEKLEKFISQREKFLANRKQHTKDLRWEVMNIELHCIFDSWNEEIIKLCSTRAGFSGIGLNQLTLSMIDHNRAIPLERCEDIIRDSRQEVEYILNDQAELNAKILKENFEEMCEHDSAWVFYADEALSYGLELVYLVEQDIYTEMAKELRKALLKDWV